jgi:hypothetical protein
MRAQTYVNVGIFHVPSHEYICMYTHTLLYTYFTQNMLNDMASAMEKGLHIQTYTRTCAYRWKNT